MGWEYEEMMRIEEMVRMIKGFVDILILGSGYQSSGLPALWDSLNFLKAFHWSLFFQQVITRLSGVDLKELDLALSHITKDPSFPPGLVHLSSTTLKNARDLVLEHLLHHLPLKKDHLKAFLTAAAEMELDLRTNSECGCLNLYVRKAILGSTSTNPFLDGKYIAKPPAVEFDKNIEHCTDGCLIKCTTRELERRESAVSCILTAEKALNLISDSIRRGSHSTENYLLEDREDREEGPVEDETINFVAWSNWKSKSISYFLDNRTLRLVSGASILFSVPKTRWMQVFNRLNMLVTGNDTEFSEAIELLLLGCIAGQWSQIIEHFTSMSFDSTTVSKQFLAVSNLLSGIHPSAHFKKDMPDPKEFGILEYLTELLGGQIHRLWKLAPTLVAVAVHPRSTLFKLYWTELEAQFKGAYSTTSCPQDKRDHKECDLVERIWCLYMFHVRGFHQFDKVLEF